MENNFFYGFHCAKCLKIFYSRNSTNTQLDEEWITIEISYTFSSISGVRSWYNITDSDFSWIPIVLINNLRKILLFEQKISYVISGSDFPIAYAWDNFLHIYACVSVHAEEGRLFSRHPDIREWLFSFLN